MKLMIVESPGKIKKLSAILGDSWKVVASFGHVRDLPLNEIGIEQESFSPNYVLTERGADVVKKLRGEVKVADEVFLATDPDREGEAISWHLEQCLGLKNSNRITFNEIKESTVRRAISEVRKIDYKLVQAQEARRVLDRFVGYLVSPVLSAGLNGKFSAGRVQSPAVRLVVDREREIRKFKVTSHFSVRLGFRATDAWQAEWQLKPDFVSDEQPYFMDGDCAKLVSSTRKVRVVSFAEAEKKRNPPAPFTTSTMQQAASVVLKMSPKDTMAVAQKLYEAGQISYHRTDNPNISPDDMSYIFEVAKANNWDAVEQQRMFKAPEGAQAGHPAITPTHWEVDTAGNTIEERALYTLIRLRALGSQLAEARYSERVVTLQAVGITLQDQYRDKLVTFEARGRTLIYAGWLKATQEQVDLDSDEEQEPNNPVPKLEEGQEIEVSEGEVLAKKTRPPTRFTEATLVRQLERDGVGRPSTYAAILDNIITREYVDKDKKNFLSATAKGELLVDALVGGFDFMNLSFTKEAETELDRIAEGGSRYVGVVSKFHETLMQQLGILKSAEHFKQLKSENANQNTIDCPDCGKSMRRINGPKGFFWGCTGFQEGCKKTFQDEDGKPITEEKPKQQAMDGLSFTCPTCKEGKLLHRTGKNGFFWGCNKYPDCKHTQPDDDGKPGTKEELATKQSTTHTKQKDVVKGRIGDKCPSCEMGKLIGREFKESGKKYVGCDAYPKCKFFCWP